MTAGKLQQELNRKQPYASLEQEAVVGLLRTSDQFENRLSRLLRTHEVTLSQFNLLRILHLENRPLNCGEIGEQMIQVVPAITGLVDRLEQQGLVQRTRCTDDRRVVHVSLTEKGATMATQAFEPLMEMVQQVLKPLTPAELKQLIRLLEKTRISMAATEKT